MTFLFKINNNWQIETHIQQDCLISYLESRHILTYFTVSTHSSELCLHQKLLLVTFFTSIKIIINPKMYPPRIYNVCVKREIGKWNNNILFKSVSPIKNGL